MTKFGMTGFAAASMLAAATSFAQTQSSATAPAQRSGAAAGAKMTVTGCIERADQLNATGGSNIGTSVDSLDFVLIKADMPASSGAASAAAPNAPRAGNTTQADAGRTGDATHPGDATRPATSGAVGTSGSSATPAATANAPAASASAPTASAAPLYHLAASVDQLNPHVGHKVEITGMRDPATAGAAAAADPANPSTATAPRFIVESVKMLSESCNR